MKILGIDSSGLVASVAIVEDTKMTAEYTIHFKKTHSQTLLPMLNEIVQMVELDVDTIDGIAISGGPGSFTGLRIGSATAKGLGQALKKPLIHVDTLMALAYNFAGAKAVICPIMDARRNQTYTGIYRFQNLECETILEHSAIGIEELISTINQLGEEVIFLGDGVEVFEHIIKQEVTVPFTFAPPHLSHQRAGSVAYLGLKMMEKGFVEDAASHRPEYLRVSQAERERQEKENAHDC